MKVLVVYESMYGTTHEVAERISAGLGDARSVEAVPVADATPERVAAADLLVVGGPTHIHGMSTAMSRHQAVSEETLRHEAEKGHDLEVDPDAEGPGLRDWFDTLDLGHPLPAAAFDTRLDGPALVTGRASKGISRRLRHHGCDVLVDPESFLVDKAGALEEGEAERAVAWGRSLLAKVAERAHAATGPVPDEPDVLDEVIESGGRYDPLP